MKDYYQILGINSSSSVEDIKRAYRQKVSKAHPDVNSSPNAHEEFIEINEAYEYLLKQKTGFVFDNEKKQYTKQKANYSTNDFINEARQRARENANRKYQEFLNSTYYKTQIAIFSIFDYLLLSIITLIFGSLIFYFIYFMGLSGAIVGGLLGFLLFSILYRVYSNMYHPPKADFKKAAHIIFYHPTFYLVLISGYNMFAFFNYAFAVFIPFKVVMTFYVYIPALLLSLSWLIRKKIIKVPSPLMFIEKWKNIAIWGIMPLLFSLFMTVNFEFSSNAHSETYFYQPDYESDGSFCVLQNGKYDEYSGIRYIFLDSNFHNSSFITLHIEKGFLGVDVLKNYSLSSSK